MQLTIEIPSLETYNYVSIALQRNDLKSILNIFMHSFKK